MANKAKGKSKKAPEFNVDETIDQLIENAIWSEDDREWLEGLDESKIETMAAQLETNADMVVDDEEAEKGGKPGKGGKKTPPDRTGGGSIGNPSGDVNARNQKSKGKPAMIREDVDLTDNEEEEEESVDDYIAKAPAALRGALNSLVKQNETACEELIESLVANKNNPFTEDFLRGKDLQELQGLAKLAGVKSRPAANYAGAGGIADIPTENATGGKGRSLGLPTMNFGEEAPQPTKKRKMATA